MLPEAAQEQIGRELLERIESLDQLRSEVEIGLRELDAGLGKVLDIEDIIRRASHDTFSRRRREKEGAPSFARLREKVSFASANDG